MVYYSLSGNYVNISFREKKDCLQDPEPGVFYLLLSPGRPRVPRHVGRVQGGAGVGVRRRGEIGELVASRGWGYQRGGREDVKIPDMT